MQVTERTGEAWWVYAIGGIAAILFGLLAIFWPGITLLVLVWLFGFYALIYGITAIVGMFRAIGAGTTWWTYLLVGVLNIAAGLLVLAYPGISAVILLYIIAGWAIVVGIVELVSSVTQAQFLLAVTGIISILFGFVLLANPLAGALALVWVIGLFAIIRGILLLVGAVRAPAEPARPA